METMKKSDNIVSRVCHSLPHFKEHYLRLQRRRVLVIPKLLKYWIVLSLLYVYGLRKAELCHLKIIEVDLGQEKGPCSRGKGRKDR